MNLLEKLINKDFTINWSEVEKITEFQKLKACGYHSTWHQEGSAFIHTQQVCSAILTLPEFNELDDKEKFILVAAGLFHDVGKGVTGEQKENGDWSFPYHAKASNKIARKMLWGVTYEVREMICSLVGYHMKPNHLIEKSNNEIDKQIIEISLNSNVKLLYLLTQGDSLGANSIDTEETLLKKSLLKERALELNCYNKPFDFFNEHTKFKYFKDINNETSPFSQIFDDTEFTVYMLSGIAGSGKDTYIKDNFSNLPVVCRDDIRHEIGLKGEKPFGNKQEESKVSQIEEERIKEYCRKKISFVHNNMNIKKMWRDKLINSLLPYNPKFEIIYLETDIENNISRRKDMISKDIILRMQNDLEFPLTTEVHNIKYLKN